MQLADAVAECRASYAAEFALWASEEARLQVSAVRQHVAQAQRALAARRAASAPVATLRAADEGALSSGADDDAPTRRMPALARPCSYVTGGSRVSLTPRSLPRAESVPTYSAWVVAAENTLVQARARAALLRPRRNAVAPVRGAAPLACWPQSGARARTSRRRT